MIGNCTTPGSNKKSVALVLKDKLLLFKSVQRRPVDQRRSFDQAWSDLQVLLMPTPLLSVNDAAAKLRVPFTASYDSEESFDKALFNALKECLVVLVLPGADTDVMFLRRAKKDADLEDGKDYAVGFARQKAVARSLCTEQRRASRVSDLNRNTASGMSYGSKPDHTVCLFEKDEHGSKNWDIKDCFAVIELKTSESTCSDFETDISEKGHVLEPSLDFIHQPLGQALLYTLGGVLPFHARRGTLGAFLPVAVLAGKKHPSTTSGEGTETTGHAPSEGGQSESLDDSEDRKPSATSVATFATMKQLGEIFTNITSSSTTRDEVETTKHTPSEAGRNESLRTSEDRKSSATSVATFATMKQVDESVTNNTSLSTTSDEAETMRHVPSEACQEDRKPSTTKRVTMKQFKSMHLEQMDVMEENDPKKLKSGGKLRWVSASISIPEACGHKLTYSVHDYGNFCNNQADEETSIEQAMVLYIDTFAFGLQSALGVLTEIEEGEMGLPKPASGQFLYVGDEYLGWELCASPIPGANAVEGNNRWTVSQGELFTGTLSVPGLLAQSSKKHFLIFLDGTQHAIKDLEVVIKVCSRAVHFHLVDPLSAYRALEKIKNKTDLSILNPDADPVLREQHLVLRQEISSVLHAAAYMGAGLETIMADLSRDEYEPLSPRDYPERLSTLWEGFRNLVTNVLLPMAKMDLIHTDIRPGFDETFNILCKFEGIGTSSERAIFKLIDYDSIVDIIEWNAPQNGSYIAKVSDLWTATTFVWWQCLAVAYAWQTETAAIDFFNSPTKLVSRVREAVIASFPDLQQHAFKNDISEAVVIQTLEMIAADFRRPV